MPHWCSIGENELFPSVAWRLLLPDPAPGDIVVLGNGQTARSARSALGAREPGANDRAAGRGADLAVGEAIDPETLRELVAALRPGGTAYVELDWPRAHRTESAIAALLAEGFESVRAYSLSPSGDRWEASWWVPIGEPSTFRFVAASRRPAGTSAVGAAARRLLVGAVERCASQLSGHPWLLHPRRGQRLGLVASLPGPDGSGSTGPGLAVRALAAAGVAGHPDGGPAPLALLRVGGSSTDQPMLFVFPPGASEPSVVVKAPDCQEEVAAQARESTILHWLAANDGPVPNIPLPVTIQPDLPFPVGAYVFVPGRPLTELASPASLESLATAVSDWLAALAEGTRRAVGPGWYQTMIDELFDDLAGDLGPVSGGRFDLERARAIVEGLDPGFTVCQHRDLGPWNVHHDERTGIGVIDWADAEPSGPPVCDQLHHLVHLAVCSTDGYRPDRLDATLSAVVDPGTDIGKLVDRCIARFSNRIGLDRATIPQLRVLTWLIDLQRQDPAQRAGSLYARLLAHELRRLPTAADRA
ncbi:MAG: aminoglycoside phosphotransferase family protein [Acidimicrobiia bacterium]|nr:aminoglycoside phosphotransferase family protein [Acidimicrobiia bacterium]